MHHSEDGTSPVSEALDDSSTDYGFCLQGVRTETVLFLMQAGSGASVQACQVGERDARYLTCTLSVGK